MTDAPEEIHNVSASQFSIARHFGGLRLNGHNYFYDPLRDILVRDDVLKRRAKEAEEARKAAKRAADDAQGRLL